LFSLEVDKKKKKIFLNEKILIRSIKKKSYTKKHQIVFLAISCIMINDLRGDKVENNGCFSPSN
jgi:hypothetical protein